MAKTVKTKPSPDLQPILYLNLRPFFIGGFFIILFSSPFMRGLFFQPELLEIHMLTAAVFALAWYDQVLRREVSFLCLPLDYAVAALIAVYALSLFTAVHMRPAVGELLKIVNYFMVYWIVIRAVREERDLDRLLSVSFAAAVGVAVIGLAAAAGYFNLPGAYDNGIIMSTMQYKNALAIYLTVLNLVGLALSVKSDRPLPKMLYALGNFLLLVVILGTQSRGGWILYPVGFAALFAGLPAAYRWRAAYHMVIFMGCGLVAARLFLPRAMAGNGHQAMVFLLLLAAATLFIQYAYHRLGLWLGGERIEDRTRRAVALGGLAYMGFVAVFYLFYAAVALPSALAAVLPSHVARRVETIATGDTTLPDRFEMTRDALRIAADHPLTGAGGGAWNALYHQYQSSLYWTTEAHNYFAQTLVEAGAIGLLSVLALWGCFIWLVVRLWRRTGREGGAWMSLWAVAVVAFILGIHSAIDFDLSLGALGILLWTFFGAVRAGDGLIAKDENAGANLPGGRKLAITALAATVGAALLFIPAASLYAAGKYGAMGARAVMNKDLDTAERYYLDARRRDPFTASYAGDLAQVYAVRAISRDDAAARFKSLEYAGEAVKAEPYNSPVRAAMVNVYLMLEEFDPAVQESENLLQTNPLLSSNYEILGRTCITAARYHMERGDAARSEKYIERVLMLSQMMKEKNDEIKARASHYVKRDPLPPTPVVNLAVGQARYLSGQYEEARQVLQTLAGYKDVGTEARLWLAVALSKLGEEQQAKGIIDALSRQEPTFEKQYNELLALH